MKNLRDFWSIEDEKEWLNEEMLKFHRINENAKSNETIVIDEDDRLTCYRFPFWTKIEGDILTNDKLFLVKYIESLRLRKIDFDGESEMTQDTKNELYDYCRQLILNPEETYLELKEEVINVEPII